jgi:predicted nucleic acid-binding protein
LIFDTDVLIDGMKGYEHAISHIDRFAERSISMQTYLELMQGAENKREQAAIKTLLSIAGFKIIHLKKEIGIKAAEIVEKHALADGIRSGDAIVAATAILTGERLSTFDKHMSKIEDLKPRLSVVKKPGEKDRKIIR